jgi:hypothetical protein
MKKTIPALVVAKAIFFPDPIEILRPADKFGNRVDTSFYRVGPLSWNEVKNRFVIEEALRV